MNKGQSGAENVFSSSSDKVSFLQEKSNQHNTPCYSIILRVSVYGYKNHGYWKEVQLDSETFKA